MTADTDYRKAKTRAAVAREQLQGTVHELQQRLAPKTIAEDAWASVKAHGEAIKDKGVEIARSHPGAAAGAGVAVAALVLRRPLAAGLKRLFRRRRAELPADAAK